MEMITTKKERIIETDSKDSSKQPILPVDVIISILDRLSFVDFLRARCVSSYWYFSSRSCIQGRINPWIIFFPKVNGEINNDTCKFFNPRDKSSHIVRHPGFDFASCRCFASCGSWFLMLENRILLLLNVFSRERIPLPSLALIDGTEMTFMRLTFSNFFVTLDYKDKTSQKNPRVIITGTTGISKAALWVDEKTRDYFVVWSNGHFLAYHKRGDNNNNNNDERWKVIQHLKNEDCLDMVFKESKLYVLRTKGTYKVERFITVFDFSHGDSPMECARFPCPFSDRYDRDDLKNIALTLSGEVLIISDTMKYFWRVFDQLKEKYPLINSLGYYFNIYKLDKKSSECRRIESIGDEALLLDVGITVATEGGVSKNCIYFTTDEILRYKGNYVYDTETKELFQVCEDLNASYARWFFSSFG